MTMFCVQDGHFRLRRWWYRDIFCTELDIFQSKHEEFLFILLCSNRLEAVLSNVAAYVGSNPYPHVLL
uniref:PX domain-containing protein n=1 Tax=Mesocestoides corti TaxID=53468 RepID=A0A5K3EYG7_MESCO